MSFPQNRFKRFLTIARLNHLIAITDERYTQCTADLRIVIDDKNRDLAHDSATSCIGGEKETRGQSTHAVRKFYKVEVNNLSGNSKEFIRAVAVPGSPSQN